MKEPLQRSQRKTLLQNTCGLFSFLRCSADCSSAATTCLLKERKESFGVSVFCKRIALAILQERRKPINPHFIFVLKADRFLYGTMMYGIIQSLPEKQNKILCERMRA
jgi:hypothetical protein